MKYLTSFLHFIVYLCLSLSLFVGCTETQTTSMTPSEDPDNQTDASTETVTIITKTTGRIGAISNPPSPACDILIFEDSDDFHYDKSNSILPPFPEQLHIDAFTELSELRQRFESSLFADNFRLLRILTDSQNYLAFLSEASPIHAPYSTLDDFWKTQPPPSKEIIPLFEGMLENPSEKQIIFIHSQALSWQCFFFDAFFNIDNAKNCNPAYPFPFIPEVTDRPHIINAIYFASRHEIVDFIGGDWDHNWTDPLFDRRIRYAEDTNHIYQKKIRGFFNRYGADTGMLWLAIQEPAITGFILGNFTHENMLKAWIKDGYEGTNNEHSAVLSFNNDKI